MRDLNDLMYFAAVVDHGGFSAASRALGIPKSKLSRRVAALEAQLGVRLLNRNTRSLIVTELGQRFHTHCKAMLVEAEAAETTAASARAEPCGTVRLSCPIALLHMQVADMLIEFARRYPQVKIHLTAANRAVDLLAEGLDVALRVRALPLADSDLAMRTLGTSRQCLVASPALVALHGEPEKPEDLTRFPSLAHASTDANHAWQFAHPDGTRQTISHQPRLITTDMLTLSHAAQAALGIVELPQALVKNELASGKLIELLPSWNNQTSIIHAVFPSRRGLISAVRVLLDFLADEFAKQADSEDNPTLEK